MNFEKRNLGEFSMTSEEEQKIRKKAKREGIDPDKAVEDFKARLERATERKRAGELEEVKQRMMEQIEGEEAPTIEELKEEWEE